jgi:hypothetical protein
MYHRWTFVNGIQRLSASLDLPDTCWQAGGI